MNKSSHIIIIVILTIAAFFFSSCSFTIEKQEQGPSVEKTFDLTEFKGIDVQYNGKIIYTVGDTLSLRAEAPQRMLDKLNIFVGKDSILHILCKDDMQSISKIHYINFHNDDQCTIHITGPSLSSLNLIGASDFECHSTMQSEYLDVRVTGAGDLDFDTLLVNNFSTNVSGAGDIDIKALVGQKVKFVTAGAGDIDAKLIKVAQTDIHITGAGDIKADFDDCDTANIEISGAGDLTLSGTLRHLDKNIAGAGDINDKNLKIINK